MPDPSDVRTIFDQAVELPASERSGFLDRVCGGHGSLRQEVDRLLRAYERFGDMFETGDPAESDQPEGLPRGVPPTVGAYRIEKLIGQGGGGAVFRATRQDNEFTKTVAIKLLQPGLHSAEIVRRFRNERQILAAIDHPYVAKLLDGGSTPDGFPYLVMEYIDGVPIDVYCQERQLSIHDRLRLFRAVCDAVHFAHQNLVIHRDIKPGNILVTRDGTPKLLDFGIAKLLSPGTFAVGLDVTAPDSRPMTPEYASPEQIRGESITTASDVYLLGVLLFRLLTGERPYRLRTSKLLELAAAICEQEPVAPSAAAPHLRRQLEGDLDNIVLKALQKEPNRRYGSAQQLSDDVERHLAYLPVHARPDTVRYRASKFVRRHRLGVATAAGFLLVVVSAAVGLSVQAARIAEQRDRADALRRLAERETAKARGINDFLLRTLGAANPQTGTGREVTLAAALDGAANAARHAFANDPEIEAGVLNVVGMTFLELGRLPDAAPLLERALSLRRQALGDDHLDVAESLESKAVLRRAEGRVGDAERLFVEALTIARRATPPQPERTARILHGLGVTRSNRGDEKAALSAFEEALDIARSAPVSERSRAELLTSAGVSMRRLGDYERAEAGYREALAIQRRLLGPRHAEVATLLNNLAVLLNQTSRHHEAEPLQREALEIRRAVFGAEHPLVANSMLNLAASIERRGDLEGAEKLNLQALTIVRTALGPEHPRAAFILRNLGVLLVNRQRGREGIPHLRDALRIRQQALGPKSQDVADAMTALAYGLRQVGAHEEAEGLNRQALAIHQDLIGSDTEPVAVNQRELGALLCRSKEQREAALKLLMASVDFYARHPNLQPVLAAAAHGEYGECLTKAGRYAEAEKHLIAAHERMTTLAPGHLWAAQSARRISELYRSRGKRVQTAQFGEAPSGLQHP